MILIIFVMMFMFFVCFVVFISFRLTLTYCVISVPISICGSVINLTLRDWLSLSIVTIKLSKVVVFGEIILDII